MLRTENRSVIWGFYRGVVTIRDIACIAGRGRKTVRAILHGPVALSLQKPRASVFIGLAQRESRTKPANRTFGLGSLGSAVTQRLGISAVLDVSARIGGRPVLCTSLEAMTKPWLRGGSPRITRQAYIICERELLPCFS